MSFVERCCFKLAQNLRPSKDEEMADLHYEVNESTSTRAQRLMQAVRTVTIWLSALDDELAAMATMKDGDGSNVAHFVTATTLYGVADTTTTKAIYDELASAMGNSGALRQFLARMG
jgi:hypothetical protein